MKKKKQKKCVYSLPIFCADAQHQADIYLQKCDGKILFVFERQISETLPRYAITV